MKRDWYDDGAPLRHRGSYRRQGGPAYAAAATEVMISMGWIFGRSIQGHDHCHPSVLLWMIAVLIACPASGQSPLPAEGGSLELALAVNEERRFTIELAEGEFLHVEVDQRSANVELELFEGEASRWYANLQPWAWGKETVFALPDTGATYRLVVRSVSSRAGTARLRVLRRGSATDRERLRFVAEDGIRSTHVKRAERGSRNVTDAWVATARRSAEAFKDLMLPGRQAMALERVAALLIQLGRPLEALAPLDEAIAVANRAGDRWRECGARRTRSEAVYARSAEEAIEEERFILESFDEAIVTPCILSVLRLLVYDLNQMGEHDQSIALFERALPLADQLDEPWERSALYMNVGTAYLRKGEYMTAIEAFTEAHEGYLRTGDHRSAILALDNRVMAQRALGERESVLETQREVVAFLEAQGEPENLPLALASLGLTLTALDRLPEAESVFRRAEASLDGGPLFARAQVQQGLGRVLTQRGRLPEAKQYLDAAYRAHREFGSTPGAIRDLELRGRWQEASGLSEQAIESYRLCAEQAKAFGLFSIEVEARKRTAELLWELGRMSAVPELERAISIVEDARRRLPTDRFRSTSAKHLRALYDLALEIELAPSSVDGAPASTELTPKKIERAFLLSERARARSLRDFLEAARTSVVAEIDPALVQREQDLLKQLEALSKERFEVIQAPETIETERLATLERSIAEADLALEAIAAERFRRDPRRAALLDARPIDLPTARAALGDRALVSYHLLGDRILLFVLTAEALDLRVLTPSQDTGADADALSKALRQPSRIVGRLTQPAHRLWRTLLAPVADSLAGRQLIISPDGWLHEVPFDALVVEPARQGSWHDVEFAAKRYEISYTPSVGVLASQLSTEESPSDNRTLVAFGDAVFSREETFRNETARTRSRRIALGSLPHARSEVESVAAMLAPDPTSESNDVVSHVFLGKAATESTARSERATSARYLHFAVHAFVDHDLAGQSTLVLTPDDAHDGMLQLREVVRMRFAADLVTLSACETSVGRQEAGEGVMSLARGFLFAGAASLVASLWEVSDRATASLMAGLYRELRAGKTKAASLRVAKLALLAKPETAHPYYWAPFVLVGNPE